MTGGSLLLCGDQGFKNRVEPAEKSIIAKIFQVYYNKARI